MREIKFRGKTTKNEWIYGGLVQNSNLGTLIVRYIEHIDGLEFRVDCFEVDPETVELLED